MTTSGSYDFSDTVTRDDIIHYGLRKIGVLKRGQTLGADDISDASFALNLIIKQWQDRSDGSPSVKMWLRKRLVLFLQNDQYEYHIGANAADHCAEADDLLETTITAAASSGASTLTLALVLAVPYFDFNILIKLATFKRSFVAQVKSSFIPGPFFEFHKRTLKLSYANAIASLNKNNESSNSTINSFFKLILLISSPYLV